MARLSGTWASLPGVLAITALWGAANAVVRLFAGTRLAFDDGKVNLFTQTFQWGYLPDNPPLYEWTLSLVQLVTGPTLVSLLIAKYGLLLVTAGFTYLSARRILGSETWAAMTVF